MSLCGTDGQTTNKQVKIELLSQWMLEAEFRKISFCLISELMSSESRAPILKRVLSSEFPPSSVVPEKLIWK